jgi:DMSO/TMAO reductase YedYZ heme-binding membrane subunit
MLRAAGIGAYLLLFGSVAWGLVGTTSLVGKRVAKTTSVAIHQFMTTVALVLLLGHVVGLMVDPFMPFGPAEILLPMTTDYRPVAVSLGIVSMYMVVLIAVTSWLRKRIRTTLWRTLHLLAVPAFAMALTHGLLAGTDGTRSWMFWTYAATGTLVVFLVLVRAFTHGFRPARAPTGRGTSGRRALPAPHPPAVPQPAPVKDHVARGAHELVVADPLPGISELLLGVRTHRLDELLQGSLAVVRPVVADGVRGLLPPQGWGPVPGHDALTS